MRSFAPSVIFASARISAGMVLVVESDIHLVPIQDGDRDGTRLAGGKEQHECQDQPNDFLHADNSNRLCPSLLFPQLPCQLDVSGMQGSMFECVCQAPPGGE